MTLFRMLSTICLSIALTAPAPAAGNKYNHVSHGPILGRLSANGVGIWARTMRTGHFAVRYGTEPGRLDRETKPIPTRLERDNTGWVHITGLKANTRYYYELFIPNQTGLTGKTGSFLTMPDSKEMIDAELNPRLAVPCRHSAGRRHRSATVPPAPPGAEAHAGLATGGAADRHHRPG